MASPDLEARVNQFLLDCGKLLGAAREAQHLSLREVAEEIPGLDPKGLSKFERGRGKVTLKTFIWLVLYYDIPWEQLFATMPSLTRQQLFTALLKTPPDVQEAALRLWYGLYQQGSTGGPLPAPASCSALPVAF